MEILSNVILLFQFLIRLLFVIVTCITITMRWLWISWGVAQRPWSWLDWFQLRNYTIMWQTQVSVSPFLHLFILHHSTVMLVIKWKDRQFARDKPNNSSCARLSWVVSHFEKSQTHSLDLAADPERCDTEDWILFSWWERKAFPEIMHKMRPHVVLPTNTWPAFRQHLS